MRDYKNNQDEPANEEDRRWNQVWSNMINPPAADRWNGKHERDEQDAFAIRDRKDGSKQHQRKQNRYYQLAALNFFDKGEKEEQQRAGHQKLPSEQTTTTSCPNW